MLDPKSEQQADEGVNYMAEVTKKLTEAEVRQRLASYDDPKVTDQLYNVGKSMVDEAVDRFKTLDTKATAIAAYAIALITFLASTQAMWARTPRTWATVAPLAAGIISFSAALITISSLWLKRFEWFSQDEWMKAECLNDIEKLRRYHIITMWGIQQSYQRLCRTKATRIALGQGLLLASAVILMLALLNSVV